MTTDSPIVDAASSAIVSSDAVLRGKGRISISPYAVIDDHVLLDTGSSLDSYIDIGPRARLKYGAVLRTYDGYVRIGSRSSVGEYTILAGHGGLAIGSLVIIAGHCLFSAAEHIHDGPTPVRFQGEMARGIVVEDGAWFGGHVVVLDGVTVGQNAIVGAGSVVTSNLRANMVCWGAPCREIRAREHTNAHEW